MAAAMLDPCRWCLRRGRASEWEQENLSGVYNPLCTRCATRRLGNPYNALLPMRKAEPQEDSCDT